ncbi:gamma-glutamyl-gamma-aminobutyrate hydrolase family protein [Brevibacterium zhoupengii]|uniref:gamma-glutamyl-gamma-aminobutyrate hydrolase family protein n=1 Tax=Brevibacterium zhoupengii TaxID=2898795 RepID=UPI001E367505|nr:gamma-glutamyl-gamma-aminobutyrate hydrolase family protein [Brevibacterium zhoupengii]
MLTTSPTAEADVEIAVIVGLNMPGQTEGSISLQKDLTITAVDSIHELGGKAVIHDVSDGGEPDYEAIAAADGILVLGGGDVDATIYGHTEVVPNEYGKDRRADERELKIIARGIGEDSIMLHLCRGSQLLNVACGGTLIPDLDPYHLHKGAPGEPLFLDEVVQLEPGHIIHDLYQVEQFTVRNGHHQAVGRVGTGLSVAARAADGIVEATQRVDNTWILGVQWHPEEAGASKTDRDVLFAAFLERARTRTRSRGPAIAQN